MLEKIAEMIIEQLQLPEGTVITEDTNFLNDLRADSFELVELVMALEEEYGLKMEDEDLESFKTVGDVMEYLRAQGIELE